MKYSVIIPTYNRCNLIEETLKSIVSQTHLPAQILVVDDGSTDNTEDVVRNFDVEYIKISNSGPGCARNVGVSHSKQDWIAFCDSDDIWKPNYLELFTSYLKPTSFYGFANWFDIENMYWTSIDKFSSAPLGFFDEPEKPFYRKLIDFTPIWPSATIVKKDFFNKVGGFNSNLSRYPTEDYDFALRCNEYCPAVIMHEPLVGIRKHLGNYSQGRIRQNLSDADILCWARENHITGKRLQSEMTVSITARRLSAFREAFIDGNFTLLKQVASMLPIHELGWKELSKLVLAKSGVPVESVIRRLFGR